MTTFFRSYFLSFHYVIPPLPRLAQNLYSPPGISVFALLREPHLVQMISIKLFTVLPRRQLGVGRNSKGLC